MSKQNGQKPEHEPIDPENKLSDQEYNNRRRLEAINDARERVSDVVLDSEKALMHGQTSEQRTDWAVHASVKMLIRECEWVIKNHSEAKKYMQQFPIGSMRLADEDMDLRLQESVPGAVIDDGVLTFYGLASVLQAPRTITVSYTVEEQTHLHGKQTKEKTEFYPLSRHISMNAYDAVFDILGDSDLNLTFDSGRPLGRVTPDIGDDV